MNYGRNDHLNQPEVARDFAAEAAEANTRCITPQTNIRAGRYVWMHQDGSVTIESSVEKMYREREPGDQIYTLGQEVTIDINVTPVSPKPHVTHRGIQGKTA